jgi:hypothetical protein
VGYLIFAWLTFLWPIGCPLLLIPLIALVRLTVFQIWRMNAVLEARPALDGACQRLGLRFDKRSIFSGDELIGEIDGLSVRIGSLSRVNARRTWNRPPASTQILVKLPARLPLRFAVFSEGFEADAIVNGEPSLTADEVFDHLFAVYGLPGEIAARLDASLRRRMAELYQRAEMRIESDEIALITREPLYADVLIVKLLERTMDLARDLVADRPRIPARLLANSMSDPLLSVRYHNLDLLLREYPSSADATEALRLAWDAPERRIRCLAAVRKGQDGLAFLEQTAGMGTEPDDVRLMALRHVARSSPEGRVVPLLRSLIKDESRSMARAAIDLLGRFKDRASVSSLVALGRRWSTDYETRLQIVDALGNIGDALAEDFVLALLQTMSAAEHAFELRLAAVAALGRMGTPRSIKTLKRIAQRFRSIDATSHTANASIGAIEVRCGPRERGELALADIPEPRGALSIAADSGALSTIELRVDA